MGPANGPDLSELGHRSEARRRADDAIKLAAERALFALRRGDVETAEAEVLKLDAPAHQIEARKIARRALTPLRAGNNGHAGPMLVRDVLSLYAAKGHSPAFDLDAAIVRCAHCKRVARVVKIWARHYAVGVTSDRAGDLTQGSCR